MVSRILSGAASIVLLALCPARAITVVLDYTYDTSGFFTANPTAKTDLAAAASLYGSLFGDTLSAINPSASNTWSAVFTHPGTGAQTNVPNLDLAQNEVRIFVGAAALGNGTLGVGGPGGFSASGSAAFLNLVQARGQAGALTPTPTDFGPWGGSIRFDLNTSWYFDGDVATTETFAGRNDFYSVALHEMGHVFGIGTALSWQAKVSGDTFVGAASMNTFGGVVPLSDDLAHWADGTVSTIFGTSFAQEAVMDPDLTTGERKLLTALDVAGFQDIGWTVVAVPEPGVVALLAASAVFLAGCCRGLRPAKAGRCGPPARSASPPGPG